ncbi:MAG: hypothetical protein ACI9QD_000361 [Thermoproteota archaeon]|jgi:hypothetical protein
MKKILSILLCTLFTTSCFAFSGILHNKTKIEMNNLNLKVTKTSYIPGIDSFK